MIRIKPAMRDVYQRGKIYWIAYKAINRVIREFAGTTDRRRSACPTRLLPLFSKALRVLF